MRRVRPLLLMLLLAGCSAPVPTDGATLELSEFAIAASSTHYVSGPLTLELANIGEFPHTVVVTDTAGSVIDASRLIGPGASERWDIDLSVGEYRLTCRIVAQNDDGELVDHFEEGMVLDIEVVG